MIDFNSPKVGEITVLCGHSGVGKSAFNEDGTMKTKYVHALMEQHTPNILRFVRALEREAEIELQFLKDAAKLLQEQKDSMESDDPAYESVSRLLDDANAYIESESKRKLM